MLPRNYSAGQVAFRQQTRIREPATAVVENKAINRKLKSMCRGCEEPGFNASIRDPLSRRSRGKMRANFCGSATMAHSAVPISDSKPRRLNKNLKTLSMRAY